ncbi:LPXTG cell wall anchor domain-containing protein [uncultured Lactobacillus sp.]|uniref:mucin-binding protein n=2 Tax=uncultured Lactobacillus sp. TaxID=153152 RepID=UPI0028060A25|nr:LPXTG cell wall anchor domain-containing protein [uncultured Lactobacillus sp.]
MKINSDNKVIVDFQHDQCQGKEITVTYDNLKNSYYLENIDNKTNKIKISKIERTFLGIHAGDTIFTSDGHTPTSDGVYDKCYGPQLIIYNDPYDGFFYNNIKQVSVKDIYYDDKGNPITFKDGDKNKAWIFVTSLNSDGVGNNNHRGDGKEYLEKVKAENPDDTPAEMKKIAGSTVTGPVDENTTKDFTRTVELFDGHSNGDYLRNYLRTNADDLKKQGWIWQENSSELTQTVTLHVKKTNDGYVYDNADAFFKGLTLPPISENGTEKYPDIEIPEVRVGTKTAVRIRVSYSANSSTQKPLDKPEVDVDEEEVPDTHDGWWYSDESNSPQNNYPDWDNKSEDNRYAFVGAVAIQYQPGMTITYGADDTAWGSHWACTQTQVVSTLNERVIIYDHIKDGVQEVTPETKPNDVPNNTVKEAQPDQLKVVVIRNIKYKLDNGSGKPDSMEDMNVPSSAIKQQIVKFDGTAYVDKVTGQLVNAIKDKNGNWIVDSNNSATPSIKWSVTNNGKLAGFEPPKIENYNNNQTHISEKTVQRPSQDTTETVYVVYSKIIKGSITVKVHDKTTNKDLSEYGEASGTNAVGTGFEYDKDTTIKKLTNAGYKVLNPKIVIPTEITKGNQVFTILVEHTITTITPDNPGHPGQPVDPDNPDGPKYPDGTDEYQVKRTGTQIIHYVGAGDKPPADNKQAFVFTREITFDNVTGKIISVTSWNVESHTFGNVDTPVIPGYHADKVVAGGATVTPDDLNRVITVTYAPDGNPGNPSDHGDTPSPEPTPEPEPTPNPTPDDQPDSETSSDEHFEKVKAKDKLDKTNPKKVAAYKKERKIIKTKIAKQGHTEIAEPIEDKVTRENNVKVVSDPVENMAAEPKLPQTGEADNSIIGLLGMLLASFAAMFGFDSLHSHDKKHKN